MYSYKTEYSSTQYRPIFPTSILCESEQGQEILTSVQGSFTYFRIGSINAPPDNFCCTHIILGAYLFFHYTLGVMFHETPFSPGNGLDEVPSGSTG